MANKIFKSILAVAILVLFITTGFVIDEIFNSFNSFQLKQLRAKLDMLAYGVTRDGISFLDGLEESDYRITVVDIDGNVLYDNMEPDLKKMDNQLNREEFREALKEGYGTSSRTSSSLMENMIYDATLLKNNYLLRVGIKSPTIFYSLSSLITPLILFILVIVAVSFYFAYNSTKKIVAPLNSIDTNNINVDDCYKEIKPVLTKLVNQQEQINNDREELLRRKKEFDAITNNMNEGMILVSNDLSIVNCNKKAYEIISADESILNTSIEELKDYDYLSDMFDDAKNHHYSSKRVYIDNQIYEIEISPITVDEKIEGYLVLYFNITYLETNEILRREFASNVSHELKTPLQSISGYAELLKSGMVDAKDRQVFYERIYNESKHMIELVSDVIKISRLDDDNTDFTKQLIRLDQICDLIIGSYLNNKKNVVIDFEKEECEVYGNKELIESIVYNLLDNAVKYSKDNDTVIVRTNSDDKYVYLEIKDNGIGIPKKEQERIFERFYRVDKGRSSSSSGSGIGLSIVKHACLINNATIEVDSKPGKGSTFRVTFNKP